MTNLSSEDPFSKWLLRRAMTDPEAYFVGTVKDTDGELMDGRTMWAQSYGEAPHPSPYKGTEGIMLTGHIHLDDDDHVESYLPTMDGQVLRVVTDSVTCEVLEGPTTLDADQQISLIQFLDEQLPPT